MNRLRRFLIRLLTPGVERVEKIELGKDEAYVLSYAGVLSAQAMDNIKSSWYGILGPNAPRVIVLEENLKLSKISTK
jgi:hypothetical protein